MSLEKMAACEIIDAIDAYAVECESAQGASMRTIVRKNQAIAEVYRLVALRDAAAAMHPVTIKADQ